MNFVPRSCRFLPYLGVAIASATVVQPQPQTTTCSSGSCVRGALLRTGLAREA